MNSPDLIQLLFTGVLIGALTAYLANGRGRDPVRWFFIGMLCGVFGLIALFFFPVIPQEGQEGSKSNRDRNKFQNESGNQSGNQSGPQVSPESTQIVTPIVEDPLAKPWYYLDEKHQKYGPIAVDSLEKLFIEKKITSRTYMWTQGMEGWKRLEELSDLQARLNS